MHTQAHTESDTREACQGRPILLGPDSKQLERKAAVGRSRQEQETQDWGQVDTEFLAGNPFSGKLAVASLSGPPPEG